MTERLNNSPNGEAPNLPGCRELVPGNDVGGRVPGGEGAWQPGGSLASATSLCPGLRVCELVLTITIARSHRCVLMN